MPVESRELRSLTHRAYSLGSVFWGVCCLNQLAAAPARSGNGVLRSRFLGAVIGWFLTAAGAVENRVAVNESGHSSSRFERQVSLFPDAG